MLVLTDSKELTDERLDPKEALAKLKEENAKLSARTRKPDQDILCNKDMAQGTLMEWQHLVFLLKKLNPELIIKDGAARIAGTNIGAIQIRYKSNDEWDSVANGGDGTKYVTGFFKEGLPEFSWETEDDRGRPTRHIRGWRTVVLQLIEKNIISYNAAIALFDEPHGVRSGRWKRFVRNYKT